MRYNPKNALGVAVEDAFHDIVFVSEFAPFAQYALVRQTRVIAPEHHLVLEPRSNIDLELRREVLGRPAGELPIHVALVQRDGRHLVDPRVARMCRDDGQIGKSPRVRQSPRMRVRIFAPMPPGMPAPMPVVPTSIITGALRASIVSKSG